MYRTNDGNESFLGQLNGDTTSHIMANGAAHFNQEKLGTADFRIDGDTNDNVFLANVSYWCCIYWRWIYWCLVYD